MTAFDIIHPDYFRIIERKVGGWSFKGVKMVYRKIPLVVDMQDFKLLYGISKREVVTELFRINGGRKGYYLADLRHKKYYYCGLEEEDVKDKFLELGISRKDPRG